LTAIEAVSAVGALGCAGEHFHDLAVSDRELGPTFHGVRKLAGLSPAVVEPDRRDDLVADLLNRAVVERRIELVSRRNADLCLTAAMNSSRPTVVPRGRVTRTSGASVSANPCASSEFHASR